MTQCMRPWTAAVSCHAQYDVSVKGIQTFDYLYTSETVADPYNDVES